MGNRWRCDWAIDYIISKVMSMTCGVVIDNITWVNDIDLM